MCHATSKIPGSGQELKKRWPSCQHSRRHCSFFKKTHLLFWELTKQERITKHITKISLKEGRVVFVSLVRIITLKWLYEELNQCFISHKPSENQMAQDQYKT